MFAPEKILPAIVATACLVALVRLCLGARRQHRFDQTMQGMWRRIKTLPQRFKQRVKNRPMSQKEAAQLAQDAIERARRQREGEWDGNVFKPKSFKGPRKPH